MSAETVPAADRTREVRAELLARAERAEVIEIADRCLESAAEPRVMRGPEVGMVMLTVREPVEATRFHLGEVLVTTCEVEHRGTRGWVMRMGDDRHAALAAAVLDAEAVADGPLADDVEALCARTADRMARERAREWADVHPTIVDFEEMD